MICASVPFICDSSLFVGPYCSEFRCQNDKCIDRSLMCDGIDHCFDHSDERNCELWCFCCVNRSLLPSTLQYEAHRAVFPGCKKERFISHMSQFLCLLHIHA